MKVLFVNLKLNCMSRNKIRIWSWGGDVEEDVVGDVYLGM